MTLEQKGYEVEIKIIQGSKMNKNEVFIRL